MRLGPGCEACGVRVRAATYTHVRGRRYRALAVASVCLVQLAALAFPGAAHAEYGELGRFPFSVAQVNPHGGAHSFAVDSSDGSFYVADEPKEGEYRIQRFNVKGELQASTSFKPPEAKHEGAGGGVVGEGGLQIVVDPARNRIYALLLYLRRGKNGKEEAEEEKECEEHSATCYERNPLDSEELAAGDLYGFEYDGSKELVPMKAEQGNPAPVLGEKGADSFRDQGETPKEALLNPRGLAVDPKTGDIVIAGEEDQQESNTKVEKEEAEKECRGAAQLVTRRRKSRGKESVARAPLRRQRRRFGPRAADLRRRR